MVYLAVNKDGTEQVFDILPPVRYTPTGVWLTNEQCDYSDPWYIEKLIGRTLTWEDNYVEI